MAIVSLIQLLICIVSEYQRLKQPSFLRACRLTTQKLLYFVVFIAALLRGAYFTTPVCLNVFRDQFHYNNLLGIVGSTATSMGFKFDVSLLPFIDDVCISGCLFMGRGK